MKPLQKVGAAAAIAQVRLLGRRIPVAVRINLNNRCHSRCHYCSLWHTPTEEMSTSEVYQLIHELAELGTKRLTLSGGEPMLRSDLGTIIDYAVSEGMSVDINSTGYLFRKRQESLKRLDLVKLSLDGGEAVHDHVRGREGAFRELIDAIAVLGELRIPFSFACTLTKHNLGEIPFLLDFAEQHDTFVAFQPVMAHEHSSEEVKALFPERSAYLAAVALLQREKKKRGNVIRNSDEALRHIEDWPHIHGLRCWAGEVFLIVEPNGDVIPCDRITYDQPVQNWRKVGLTNAIAEQPAVKCEGCGFCGAVELNMLMAGRVGIVPGLLRVVQRKEE